MKTRDNIIPIDRAVNRTSTVPSTSLLQRVMRRIKRFIGVVMLILVLVVLGGVLLLQG